MKYMSFCAEKNKDYAAHLKKAVKFLAAYVK